MDELIRLIRRAGGGRGEDPPGQSLSKTSDQGEGRNKSSQVEVLIRHMVSPMKFIVEPSKNVGRRTEVDKLELGIKLGEVWDGIRPFSEDTESGMPKEFMHVILKNSTGAGGGDSGETPTGTGDSGKKPTGTGDSGEKPTEAGAGDSGEKPTGAGDSGEKPTEAGAGDSGEKPTGAGDSGGKPTEAGAGDSGGKPTGAGGSGEKPTGTGKRGFITHLPTTPHYNQVKDTYRIFLYDEGTIYNAKLEEIKPFIHDGLKPETFMLTVPGLIPVNKVGRLRMPTFVWCKEAMGLVKTLVDGAGDGPVLAEIYSQFGDVDVYGDILFKKGGNKLSDMLAEKEYGRIQPDLIDHQIKQVGPSKYASIPLLRDEMDPVDSFFAAESEKPQPEPETEEEKSEFFQRFKVMGRIGPPNWY